ncbi:MAG TPA: TetR/AcrR family transcriptional regulator [Steroidobacter sp.]
MTGKKLKKKAKQPGVRGRPRRFDDRRVKLLRTAADLFSERGFQQTTLEDIAAALGITRPALYYYADSKDSLLAEIGELARTQVTEAFEVARKQATGAAQLAEFFRLYSTFVCSEFGRCFVLTGLNQMAPKQREAVRETQIMFGDTVADMIRLGMRDGTLRECDPVIVARAIFASFNFVAQWWNKRRDPPLAIITETHLDLFFAGVASRRAPGGSAA